MNTLDTIFNDMPYCALTEVIEEKYIRIAVLYEFSRINSREFLDVMIE